MNANLMPILPSVWREPDDSQLWRIFCAERRLIQLALAIHDCREADRETLIGSLGAVAPEYRQACAAAHYPRDVRLIA